MIMIQCSKELMNYWDKLEPTDENVSRLDFNIFTDGNIKNMILEMNTNSIVLKK